MLLPDCLQCLKGGQSTNGAFNLLLKNIPQQTRFHPYWVTFERNHSDQLFEEITKAFQKMKLFLRCVQGQCLQMTRGFVAESHRCSSDPVGE